MTPHCLVVLHVVHSQIALLQNELAVPRISVKRTCLFHIDCSVHKSQTYSLFIYSSKYIVLFVCQLV